MTMIDNGVQGAKRQAVKNDPLLQIVVDIIAKNPKKDHLSTKLAREFQAQVERHKDSIDLTNRVFEYFYVNTAHRVTKKPPTAEERAARKAQTASRVDRHRRQITMKIEAKAKSMFLDMVMPNNKSLRECTGSELRVMEPKLAKTMKFLVDTIKPRQTVGSVYATNKELLAAAKVK